MAGTSSTGEPTADGTTTGSADESSTGQGPEEAREEWPLLGCDPLVPSYCSAPFPSNVYTVEDESTATGRRVEMAQELIPVDAGGNSPMATPWNELDGFSPGIAIAASRTIRGKAPAGH